MRTGALSPIPLRSAGIAASNLLSFVLGFGGYKERESVELKFTHPLANFLLACEKVDIRSLLATEFDLSNIENRETSSSGLAIYLR
jgi:hypothetical protein